MKRAQGSKRRNDGDSPEPSGLQKQLSEVIALLSKKDVSKEASCLVRVDAGVKKLIVGRLWT